jgi:hypothetical protein
MTINQEQNNLSGESEEIKEKTNKPNNTQQITKSELIKVSLSGNNYLDFHSIAARVVFNEKLSKRTEYEEIVKIALKRLKNDLDEKYLAGEQFVSSTSL